MATTIGWSGHRHGVESLIDSFETVAPGAPVRLAKRTSNLFRSRIPVTSRGLDVSGLTGVIEVDGANQIAEVQGMCTYETLVEATTAHGLIPLVVPQLRSITLGGAVSGLGIESTSFRNGLPHESVIEMDVLTGSGDLVTVKPGEPLFDAFANSYGALGYAVRLRIELERVPAYARVQHVGFDDLSNLARAIDEASATRLWRGERIDALDAVAFDPTESYLSVVTWTDDAAGRTPSDYTGQQFYYRSLTTRPEDLLSVEDYLWRWDTDWFWCSGAFGLHRPLVRRLWPRRWRRSEVYHRLVGLDQRFGVTRRLDARRGVRRERVIQDVEVPVNAMAEFVAWFDTHVGMRPVWLCPLRLREPGGPGSATRWPTYPLEPGTTYVNVGFWGTVQLGDDQVEGEVNREIEARVTELGGHKSLYSDAYYDRETFDALYDTTVLEQARSVHDPHARLLGLYEKAVLRR